MAIQTGKSHDWAGHRTTSDLRGAPSDANRPLYDARELNDVVRDVVDLTPVLDIHTHLFAPEFGNLNLWGIDELLTYHYLIAELFRSSDVTPSDFWTMTREGQADLIWEALFVKNTPVSEATRGVVAVLTALGLDPASSDLREAREFFAAQDARDHFSRVLELANVSSLVMTNDPLHEAELATWDTLENMDARFHAAIRMDGILNDYESSYPTLKKRGFKVAKDLSRSSISELIRFVSEAVERMNPVYLAVSLPATFAYPDDSIRSRLVTEVVLPVCREHNLPFAPMIGVKRSVNPELRLAGDGLGRASIDAVERLCAENSQNRFLVTMLSRENQHELCVAARKFRNLMPFGCWWFLNNPSIIEEVTRERLELLGTSFIPQHSDARVFEQLIYKWRHSRRLIAQALNEAYQLLLLDGRAVSRPEIERDVRRMFSDNFSAFAGVRGS